MTKTTDAAAKGPENTTEAASKRPSFLRVFSYADRTSRLLFVAAAICAIISGAMLPLMEVVFGQFTTKFNNFAIGLSEPAEFRSSINELTVYFLYLFAGKFLLTYTFSVCVSVAATRTTKAIRIHLLESVLRQDIAWFDTAEQGSIAVQVTTNGNLINNGISEKLAQVVQAISTFFAAFIVAFVVQWRLTLITFGIVPVILIVSFVCVAIDDKQESRVHPIYSNAGILAEEVFSTMRTVQSLWAQPVLGARYKALLQDAFLLGMRKSPNYAILFSIEILCVYSGLALSFWQGIRLYVSGTIEEVGDVVTVILSILLAAQSLTLLVPQIQQITKASAAAKELFRSIDRKSRIDALSTSGSTPVDCRGEVEIKDVEFAYPSRPSVPVLKGLTLSIPAGKTTALVGASGSGKSTIVGLLERWYEPLSGSIHLDGQAIDEYNIAWLRSRIRCVQQEPTLFNASVYENVSYGLEGTERSSLSAEDKLKLVKEACEASFADDFIQQLPQQYDTQIGSLSLSGGQKQRIAIARAIVSNPTVLLLDEATSALDTKSEGVVQAALDKAAQGRTTVVIAHRLSTIKTADNIVVMSHGSVVESGTHDELLSLDGNYAKLVHTQDLGSISKETADLAEMDEFEPLSLERTIGAPLDTEAEDIKLGRTMHYSLVRCLFIFVQELREIRGSLGIELVACLVGGLTFPAQSIIFSRCFYAFQLTGEAATSKGDFYALLFFIVAVANFIAYALLGWHCNRVAQVIVRRYRGELFDSIVRQDLAFFDMPQNTVGALVSRLSSHPQSLMELLSANVFIILIACINLIASCILAIVVGWKLALVVIFAALFPLVFFGYLRIRLETKLDAATADKFSHSAAIAAEAVGAIRTVSSLTLEKLVLSNFVGTLSHVAQNSIKTLCFIMFWYSLAQSFQLLALGLSFWFGGRLLSWGEYSTTQFFVVFIAVIFSAQAAADFFSFSSSISKAKGAANFVLWFRSQTPTIRQDPSLGGGNSSDEKPAHVECDHVDFAYASRPNTKVLNDVSVDIARGQFVAFVGASGCGKTSMIALLERFYDPISGQVKFDDCDLKNLCPRIFRREIGLVQQEPVLYQGSIRQNIALGVDTDSDSPVSDERIVEALQKADIFDFVSSLPEGLGTHIGARGTQLSGGEKQRLAIARALIRKPRLLLLDEATSALDSESEKMVLAALDRARDGRTTIAVAHRLSTVKGADVILVFDRGSVVEQGKHDELLQRKGTYAQMCLAQALDREVA